MNHRATWAQALFTTVLCATATAQERSFAPIAPFQDAKPAPETAAVTSAPSDRPAPASVPATAPQAKNAVPVVPGAPGQTPRRVDHSRMHYDAPGDGSLWARGAHYKASFDANGATYYPLFGPSQARHQPLALSPDAVTLGGDALACEPARAAARSGDRIEIDRGSFVEVYECAPEAVEQMFVFDTLPGAGELVVRVPIATELGAFQTADGFEFRGELGRVSYSKAVAFDARGNRVDAATELQQGSIVIRVDAAFLATATLPLTIDPVVGSFPIDTTSFNDFSPDVAYDAATQHWIAVYLEYAGGDYDVYFEMLTAAGAGIWGGYVNSNTDDWSTVSVANLASATQFLAVSTVNPGSSSFIKGRRIEAEALSLSAEFQISGSEQGPKRWPSVGGDPTPFAPSFYCVAYERIYDAFSDWDVLVRLVGPDGSLTSVIPLSNSGGTEDTAPAVSRTNGGSTWTVAWGRLITGSELQVWAGRIRFDGAILSTPFALSVGFYEDQISVSSPLVGSQKTMVVHRRDYGTDSDIVATVLDGGSILQQRNLSTMESTWYLEDQISPSVDSDGQHFLVAYSESYVHSTSDYDIYVSDLHLEGNALGLSQRHVNLAYTTAYESEPRIASTFSAGGQNRRYMAAWHRLAGSSNYDVNGALFDGVEGGPSEPFCFGDGSGPTCPCANNGSTGRGCASSFHPAGGLLAVSGQLSTWHDTALLTASGLPPTSVAIFLQSDSTIAATPFGDGLSCMAGGIVRLATKTASGGVVSYPGAGDSSVHTRGNVPLEGGMRLYQAWYRNSAAFCTSATSNVTNGVRVHWAR